MADWTANAVERALVDAANARKLIDCGRGPEVDELALWSLARAPHWLSLLDERDAEIVRLRVSGARWKPICWQMGIGRATGHRRYRAALTKIARHLPALS
jgi:hypothetical protein